MARAPAALLLWVSACAVAAERTDERTPDAPFARPADARDEDRIDGAPRDDAPPRVDADVDPGPIGETDTCAEAHDLTALARTPGGATVTGDTSTYVDDARPAAAGCTGFEADGPDAFYEVTLASGERVTMTVAAAWDVSVYVLASCADATTCRAGADAVAGAGDETLSYRAPAAGTFTLVVDGWNPGVSGPYTLTATITE